jgi:hypothetical protein
LKLNLHYAVFWLTPALLLEKIKTFHYGTTGYDQGISGFWGNGIYAGNFSKGKQAN